jgi:hypothetical protein
MAVRRWSERIFNNNISTNNGVGIYIDDGGISNAIRILFTSISENGREGIRIESGATKNSGIYISHCQIEGNGTTSTVGTPYHEIFAGAVNQGINIDHNYMELSATAVSSQRAIYLEDGVGEVTIEKNYIKARDTSKPDYLVRVGDGLYHTTIKQNIFLDANLYAIFNEQTSTGMIWIEANEVREDGARYPNKHVSSMRNVEKIPNSQYAFATCSIDRSVAGTAAYAVLDVVSGLNYVSATGLNIINPGIYRISGIVSIDNVPASKQIKAHVYVNGAEKQVSASGLNDNTSMVSVPFNYMQSLSYNDNVQLYISHTNGSNLTILGGLGGTMLTIERLGVNIGW